MYLDPSILLVFGIHVRPHARKKTKPNRKKPKQHTNPPRWLAKINESLHSQRNLVQKENKQKKKKQANKHESKQNMKLNYNLNEKLILKVLTAFEYVKLSRF